MNQPIERIAPAPAPARVGQGTAIEQSRAVAEVQAAIVVAQQVPRHIDTARTAMQQSCAMLALAERAFYRFPRSGGTVSGASVHLARELARCWGNIQYGIAELRRDDEYGESEMSAWAWDVQTNARSSQTFIVPHKRDKKGGAEKLTDLRDIYENNANMGARRLREAIFSILPPWFVEEAKELCSQTLQRGDGRPLPERIDSAIEVFGALGVGADRLEQKLGRPRDRWTQHDLTQLLVTHRSIQRGEITVDDEFPRARVTVAEIAEQRAASSAGGGEAPEVSPSTAGATAGSTPATVAPPPAAEGQRSESSAAPSTRALGRRAADVFKLDHDAAPARSKTKVVDRLGHAVVHVSTAAARSRVSDCDAAERRRVDRMLDDLAAGRITYSHDDEGVSFVLLRPNHPEGDKTVAVPWSVLEPPAEPEPGSETP